MFRRRHTLTHSPSPWPALPPAHNATDAGRLDPQKGGGRWELGWGVGRRETPVVWAGYVLVTAFPPTPTLSWHGQKLALVLPPCGVSGCWGLWGKMVLCFI